MPTPFCPKCHAKFMARIALRSKGGLDAFVDPRDMNFECKVPRYAHDAQGNPVVYVFDCDAEQMRMYPQKEYERKRRAGEL